MPDVGVDDRRLAEAQILAREYTPAEIEAKATIEPDEQLDRAVLTGS